MTGRKLEHPHRVVEQTAPNPVQPRVPEARAGAGLVLAFQNEECVVYLNRTLGKLDPKKKEDDEPEGTRKGRDGGAYSVAARKRPWYKIGRSMPKAGDIFMGEINDVSAEDGAGWSKRGVTFFKREIQWRQKFNYPRKGDQIVLIDTSGDRYRLKFSKPESAERVCLGPAASLKTWYQQKRFSGGEVRPITRDGYRDKVYFVYTGQYPEFYIFTKDEFESRTTPLGNAYIFLAGYRETLQVF